MSADQTFAYQRSIRRYGDNSRYRAQDLPFALWPSQIGVVYRAGTLIGGRRCPRCPKYIAVTSRVMRLVVPEAGRWWVHERCYGPLVVEVVE